MEDIQNTVTKFKEARKELSKAIIGQENVVSEVFMALLADGHILLEGVPGLGKTLLVRSLAKVLQLDFHRVQFTPDLMPSDIIGMEVLEEDRSTGKRFFQFNKGPIFTNILLADEINRTPPKTQSALLEAMQEREVTYAGKTYELPKPFFLLATQNPLEQSGTYPLPEAQLDRFLFYTVVKYPAEQEEVDILELTTGNKKNELNPSLTAEEILKARSWVRDIHIDKELLVKISQLVRSTRPQNSGNQLVKQYVDWGAGPRAGQSIVLASKAHAFLAGRLSVVPEDIKAVSLAVLRHRVVLNFVAKTEKFTVEDLIPHLLKEI
ncbi:MoxR family ATPase [Marivirga harenae]|uniref:AAA family ATPase n=1 Tax=Marivirga harenae TaxID=2010992 RepID=UPI0026E0EAA9|nr:MoxR family ATPase [Marivirga harenae]WKV11629.1 MoxR family ATPase [Marivirga harenae]|tara:strand:- start:132867 stop:133832 length:966 start_codon:yes stop_codon:yes gene_type:complete